MTVADFQRLIEDIYFARDSARGLHPTFAWLVEEVGELARAIRRGDPENMREEFADVFAWLATTASIAGVDLQEAAAKYRHGCPKCHGVPCECPE
ncbi:MAG: MazG nucleotide pyrophosphohydrolase domain-containing protein [Armatimonadota bacterium]|jgi:NTP pyrophosphatase (non-canonical NTP hydrolase)